MVFSREFSASVLVAKLSANSVQNLVYLLEVEHLEHTYVSILKFVSHFVPSVVKASAFCPVIWPYLVSLIR